MTNCDHFSQLMLDLGIQYDRKKFRQPQSSFLNFHEMGEPHHGSSPLYELSKCCRADGLGTRTIRRE